MMRALLLVSLLAVSACAHQAALKTPSQIVKDEAKARENAISAQERKVKLAERDAERARALAKNPPRGTPIESEVTVPESK